MTIFFEGGHVAYQIKKKEVQNVMQVKYLTYMHTPDFCADKYVLFDLNDLIGSGYDLSDTKGGLFKCWRNGIYILW